jgi:hypothetical protein
MVRCIEHVSLVVGALVGLLALPVRLLRYWEPANR